LPFNCLALPGPFTTVFPIGLAFFDTAEGLVGLDFFCIFFPFFLRTGLTDLLLETEVYFLSIFFF